MTPDQVMIWFGVIIAMNLQTSFLTPPFGFALFYLRSVAPKKDYTDRVTGENIKAVQTTEIYKGSIAFIVLQLIMVAAVIAMPTLVTGGISKDAGLSNADVMSALEAASEDDSDAQEPSGADDKKDGAGDLQAAPADTPANAKSDEDALKELLKTSK
jgi:hypothetical protein